MFPQSMEGLEKMRKRRSSISRWKYGMMCSKFGLVLGPRRCRGMCARCYHRDWLIRHPEQTKAHSQTYYRKHNEQFLLRMATRNRKRRLDMINRLGGQCACCRETNPIFLCLDHIKGGGRREYIKRGGPNGVWK